MNVLVEAEIRDLEPQPGDGWVRREATGRKALTITVDRREDWPAFDQVAQVAIQAARTEQERGQAVGKISTTAVIDAFIRHGVIHPNDVGRIRRISIDITGQGRPVEINVTYLAETSLIAALDEVLPTASADRKEG